ncbi:type II toxin-antitoxin system Phd/YefM family antitoxin [Planctellipticum variicoloris]|uniref:type II toxin-antitoxin system Phd/YefM family antitoxin n=1 Tax=Planctellipticum variicoloris TaxID=3064265 RepID=UPI003AF69531
MTRIPLTRIGAADAERDFGKLLDRVATGEEITITRRGEPVARLVPARGASPTKSPTHAIQELRGLASRNSLGGLRVQDFMAERRE